MSVVADAVKSWKSRLNEIERQIGPLVTEAEELRAAISKFESGSAAGRRAPRRAGARPAGGAPRRRRAGARAPRGQNREAILASIKGKAKTAGEVAGETGIGRATVATTLTKLAKEGAAIKADRGYKAA